MNKKILSGLVAVVFIIVVAGFTWPKSSDTADFHEHANIVVFLYGERLDLSQDKFMSIAPCSGEEKITPLTLADRVHLHDGDGDTIHVHDAGVTYADFFGSLGMQYDSEFLIDDMGNEYGLDADNEWRTFINGEEVFDLAEREVRDIDKVLISYGQRDRIESDLLAEYGAVANTACIFSESCPHRGVKPLESCGQGRSGSAIIELFHSLVN